MAWTYANPAPAARHYAGNNGVWITYSTYRTMSGIVQMRLTDVTPDNGVQFTSCSFQVQLIDSAGAVWGSGTLNKTWGVMPGFTGLTAGLTPKPLRLRVKGSLYGYVPGIGTAALAGDWTGQLRWGSP